MLKTPDLNPHATLLTLYMNAVDQMAVAETRQAIAAEYTRAEPYVFKDGRSPAALSNPYSKERVLLGSSRTLFRDGDGYFDRRVLPLSPSTSLPSLTSRPNGRLTATSPRARKSCCTNLPPPY
jgi:hypothetical protein